MFNQTSWVFYTMLFKRDLRIVSRMVICFVIQLFIHAINRSISFSQSKVYLKPSNVKMSHSGGTTPSEWLMIRTVPIDLLLSHLQIILIA